MPFSSSKRVSTSCDVIEKWFAKQIGPLHFAMVTTLCAQLFRIYIYHKSCLPRSKAFCVILEWHNDIFINGQKRLYDIFEKTSHFLSQKNIRRLITIYPKELIELYKLSAFAICIRFGLFDIYFLVNTVTQNSITRHNDYLKFLSIYTCSIRSTYFAIFHVSACKYFIQSTIYIPTRPAHNMQKCRHELRRLQSF